MIIAAISWAAVGVAAGVGGLIVAAVSFIVNDRREARREKAENETHIEERRDVARDEALALVNVRGQQIDDLERQLTALKTQYASERDAQMATIAGLQRTIDLVREQAFETLQVYAHGQRALLVTILGDLDRDPPLVDRAVTRIQEALSDARPNFPGHPAPA